MMFKKMLKLKEVPRRMRFISNYGQKTCMWKPKLWYCVGQLIAKIGGLEKMIGKV